MKKNILLHLKTILQIILVAMLGFTASKAVFAADRSADISQERLENILKTKGKGWQIKSNGGLLYINPDDKRFWFAISGVMRLDQTYFSGKARDIGIFPLNPVEIPPNAFPSGAHIRKLEIDLTGGIGHDWNYTLGIDFEGANGRLARFSDSWVAYSGFADNIEVFVGRHSANWFGLENSTSTSWYPFLERSSMANVFYPGDGLGLLMDYWLEDAGFTFLALQPDQGTKIVSNDGRKFSNDRWMGLARATFAPCHELGNVWHFGLSGVVRQNDGALNQLRLNDFVMSTRPAGARARITPALVRTSPREFFDTGLSVSRAYAGNVEFARQCGPWIIQAEYSQGLIKRYALNNQFGHSFGSSVQVRGWDIQTQYMLTGEIHKYDVRDGNFGGIDVKSPYGAWEIAARYDYVNLNDKDLMGGKEHDITLGLSWYWNNNVRVLLNYTYAQLYPNAHIPAPFNNKRNLNIISARIQVKFK